MKKLTLLTFLFVAVFIQTSAQTEPFNKRFIATAAMALQNAWEIVYGPGDSLFVTEARGYRISRISTGVTPVRTTLLDLGTMNDDWATGTGPQGGLMGMALHPDLYSSIPAVRYAKPYVYIAYVYQKLTPNTTCAQPGTATGCQFRTRISRFEYRGTALINETILVDNMPGSSDHNSGRLTINPQLEGGTYKLYYTIGDMGSGQFANTNRPNNAQVLDVMEGKILRLNTESDGDAGVDAWIPDDNPNYNGAPFTPRDYVFSTGHRNPQGLAFGVIGGVSRLFSSEQSDRADDEINLIQSNNNYGWDRVSGNCDGDVNGFQIGGQTIVNEVTNCAGTTQPVFTTFHQNATWPSSYPANGSPNSGWPTIASSSIFVYTKLVIPNWSSSLFITPLKEDRVYRLKLNAAGTAITGDTISYFRSDGNRIRRIIGDPSGTKFYVVRDNGGNSTIMEYTYTGVTLPVKLTYFKGELKDNVAKLEWETSSETNTSKFVVERSVDGVNFTDIASVAAKGNSTTDYTYNYDDNNAINQPGKVVFYRIRMVDIDAAYKYSNVISISLTDRKEAVIVSPNPVSGVTKVSLAATGTGNARWKVIDNTGAVVMQNTLELRPGVNTMTLDMTRLAAGVYYLDVKGNGIEQRVKVQKL